MPVGLGPYIRVRFHGDLGAKKEVFSPSLGAGVDSSALSGYYRALIKTSPLEREFGTTLEERRRINHQIRISQVMVIDDKGEQLGVMSPEDGRRIAAERGMDLVEVAPNARPPVCRIMDYGRFRYETRKRTKKQHQMQTKIIKLRPKTDPHDLETKLRHARRFLEGGDRVRFVVRMRGRERAVTDRWIKKLVDLTNQLVDIGTVIGRPMLEGGGVTSTVEPRKTPTGDVRKAVIKKAPPVVKRPAVVASKAPVAAPRAPAAPAAAPKAPAAPVVAAVEPPTEG